MSSNFSGEMKRNVFHPRMKGKQQTKEVSIHPISVNKWINWTYTEKHGWLKDSCITRKSPGRFLVSYTNKVFHVQNGLKKCCITEQYSWLTFRGLQHRVWSPQWLLPTYILLGRKMAKWAFWVLQAQSFLSEGMPKEAWSNDHLMEIIWIKISVIMSHRLRLK